MALTVFSRITNEPSQADIVKAHIRFTMHQITSDPFLLCETVAGGRMLWRKTVQAAFRPFPMDDDIPDKMFLFFCGAVQAMFGAGAMGSEGFKSEHLEAAAIAGDFLDSCAPIAPISQKDVDAAWTIEDASSEAAKREQYGDLDPDEWLKRVVAMDADDDAKAGKPH